MTNPTAAPTGGLTESKAQKIIRICGLIMLFLALTLASFFALRAGYAPVLPPDGNATHLQHGFFTLGGAVLLAGLTTAVVAAASAEQQKRQPAVWSRPLLAGGLTLALMVLGYAFLGVWPLGEKSIMMVDMHHQYAPLLSELRYMLLSGADIQYNFHIGLGASFIPTFAYYLASPLNGLLVLFSEAHLTEGILLITLLKISGAAVGFTALAQYLYRRRDSRMVAVGVLYALSGYVLAYSWNIMWLDVVALLPAVVLAMEHMLRTGKMTPYAVLLAVALFCNYYIGFMLCVFLVLYMVVWLVRKERTGGELGMGCLRFAGASLWAAGMAAVLLIPAALALGRTSAAGEELGEFATNFPLFDLLGRLFYGATPTIRSGNLPNLYCGIPAALLLPVYLSQKSVPLRRRLCYGGLLAAMLVSCTLTQVDLVWHGLHAPNDLPYRFSFIVCFVLLLLAAHVLSELERVSPKQILLSLTGSLVYLFLWEKLGDMWSATDAEAAEKVTTSPELIYFNAVLLVLYAAVLLIGALKKMPTRAFSRLLLVMVSAEMLIGTPATLMAMNNNEYYTNHADYLCNAKHQVIDQALRRVEELAAEEEETEGVFLRMEYLSRTTCVDTALHHYSGLTTFASSNPYCTTKFMGEMGYAINGVNSYLYHSYVPAIDSLMGLRYVVLENRNSNHPQLEYIETISVPDPNGDADQERHIYRNRLALSLGMAVMDTVKDYEGTPYDPFASQQNLYENLTGEYAQLYLPLEMEPQEDDGSSISDGRFHIADNSGVFTATVSQKGQYYAFVDCRAAEEIDVESYLGDGELVNTWSVTTHEPYIIDMGVLDEGETVNVSITGDGAYGGNIHVVQLDTDALATHLTVLENNQWQVTKQTGSTLTGTVTAEEQQVLFFSIPYDKGWQVYVDGKPTKTFPIANNLEEKTDEDGNEYTEGGDDGALLGAEIAPGQHTVTIVYRTPGFALGVMVSIASLLLLLIPVLRATVFRRRKSRPVPAETLPAEPQVDVPDVLDADPELSLAEWAAIDLPPAPESAVPAEVIPPETDEKEAE